jgi:23S rRNA (uridine2552-2'-O)-methyltransferase
VGQRRHQDHFGKRAKDEGWGARSVYKLQEIDRRFRLIRRGIRVLDLGCVPGSWSRWVSESRPVALVGVDVQQADAFPGTFLQASVHELAPPAVLDLLGGPADLVLSDMAPSTTGNRLADHLAQLELAEAAHALAVGVLAPGGTFVCKVFDGQDAPALVARIRRDFQACRRVRPEATRKESREFFLVATGLLSPVERDAETAPSGS